MGTRLTESEQALRELLQGLVETPENVIGKEGFSYAIKNEPATSHVAGNVVLISKDIDGNQVVVVSLSPNTHVVYTFPATDKGSVLVNKGDAISLGSKLFAHTPPVLSTAPSFMDAITSFFVPEPDIEPDVTFSVVSMQIVVGGEPIDPKKTLESLKHKALGLTVVESLVGSLPPSAYPAAAFLAPIDEEFPKESYAKPSPFEPFAGLPPESSRSALQCGQIIGSGQPAQDHCESGPPYPNGKPPAVPQNVPQK